MTISPSKSFAAAAAWIREEEIGRGVHIETPFGRRLICYADLTATGRHLHLVEDWIRAARPFYANTHTEVSTTGRMMTDLRESARQVIRQAVNAGDDDELITDINVTPLVDVVLVLLIILMVTATAIVSKTIPMELPKAATGEQTPSSLAVSIDQDGQIFLDTIPVSPEELRTRVRAARDVEEDLRAVIAADGRIAHAKVVQVIDILRQERITKFAINVRPEEIGR